AGARPGHRRHHPGDRDRLHQADRLRGGQALPPVPAQHLHRRQPLHPLQLLRRRLPPP
ncbi:MAG: Glutamate synthase [NADPH] small chain, partial [uncultured Thermomicrobiales bacterium]